MMMTLAEYQAEQQRTANTNEETMWRLAIAGLGIAGEAGEVANLVKKIAGHGHSLPGNLVKLKYELGDTLWYVSEICSALGITLDEVAALNKAKLWERYPAGWDPQRSQMRADDL